MAGLCEEFRGLSYFTIEKLIVDGDRLFQDSVSVLIAADDKLRHHSH